MTPEGTAGPLAIEAAASASSKIPTLIGVVFAATFGSFVSVTPTIIAVLGVFLKPIATDFGWSRSAVAGALAASALGNAITCPLAGRIADRIGPRRTALIGNLLLGLSIVALYWVPADPMLYYLAFFITGAVGSLPSTLVYAKVLSEWFDRSRGFWLGFCGGVGNASGAIVFPMFAAAMLERYGWRTGFILDGVFVIAAGFPILFFLLREAPASRRASSAAGAVAEDGISYSEAIRSARFWWIFSIVPLGAGCMTAMFSTIVPLLTDRGLPIDQAVLTVQAFAFTTLFVEPGSGFLADRTNSPKIIAPLFLVAAVGLWLMLHAQSPAMLMLAGMLVGVGAGVEYTVLPYLLSRYFGLKEFGAIAGIAFSATLLFGALVPLFLNGAYDFFGRYDPAVYAIAAILLYSSAAILTFEPYRFAARHHD